MSMRRIILLVAFTAMAGCYAETTGGVAYSGTVTATAVEPDLVYVSPGVQVIADYDEPIFYSDGFYWRVDNGVWYRSSYYTSGWVYATPPRAVVSINQPYSYRHYRPAGYVPRNRPVRNNDPYVRDHRRYDPQPQARPYNRPEPQPVVRDHRTYDPGPPRAEPARPAQPDVRDHREYTPAQAHPAQPAQPAPDVRDHREKPAPAKKDERDHRH